MRKTESVLAALVSAMLAFVVYEAVTAPRHAASIAPPSDSSVRPVRHPIALAHGDSDKVRRAYFARLGEMTQSGEKYRPAPWVVQIQLARLYAAAADPANWRTGRASARESAREEKRAASHDSESVAWTSDVLRRAHTGTYLATVLSMNHDVVIRWPSRDAADSTSPAPPPVRVWVEPRSSEQGFDAEFPGVTRAAFRKWSDVGLGVTFEIVDDSSVADVLVTWAAVMASPERIGSTFRLADARGHIVIAHVVLSTAVDVYAVQNSALHEAGHVLGLEHSPDPDDIMAPSSEGRQYRLTDADRNTALLLYQLEAGPLPGRLH